MKNISKKSYNWTFRAVEKLINLDLLELEKIGRANILSLNFNNPVLIAYLSFLEETEAYSKNLPLKNIIEIMNSIPISYFTLLVTGSYAAGKATEKSDLDIVVLVEDNIETKKILAVLKDKGELMVPEVHPYVFTRTEFTKMLLSKEENYAKFIVDKKLIFFGAENYYLILKEVAKNGFKG